jgi:hypothetical protein
MVGAASRVVVTGRLFECTAKKSFVIDVVLFGGMERYFAGLASDEGLCWEAGVWLMGRCFF